MRRAAALRLVLVSILVAPIVPGDARAADEPARRVAPDHLTGTADEMAGWWAADENKWVQARELGEKITREHPESYAGQYILGVAMHYGEGNLARSRHHLERSMELFEALYGKTPAADVPWRWHEAALRELAFTLGEMDLPAPELVILDKYDLAYSPKRIAQRVWPLMKLRRYDESRKAAKDAAGSGNAQQRMIARSDLCAAECEAGDRGRAFTACVDALADFRKAGTGGQVEYANASEAALSVFRYDDAERFLKEATQRATPDSWGNPFQHLSQLYITESRIPEAIEAVKGAQELRMRRPAWLDQHGQARLDGTIADLFMLTGVTDRAVSAAQRAVDRPDRQGVHSGTEVQADAGAAVRLAVMLHDLAAREEEDAVTSGFVEGAKLRARAAWHRLAAWRARRRAAVMLADEEFYVKSLRPYYVGGIDLPMWLMPDAVSAVGSGVTTAALARARDVEKFTGASAYFDALEVEAAYRRGDCGAVDGAATVALLHLPQAEVLLRARVRLVAGLCARRRGDDQAASGHLAHAMAKDPGLFRRLDLRLPVEIETDGSPLADRARALVEKSPRFERTSGPFRVVLRGGRQPEACLQGETRDQIACARVNLPNDTDDKVGARLLIAEFHRVAFALKADLSQADLTSLDGSPTAARADRQVQSLIDTLGGTPPTPSPEGHR